MPYSELIGARSRVARVYRDDANQQRHIWSGGLCPLHFQSNIDSGSYDTPVNLAAVQVNNAQLDGWRVIENGWHYALGIDKTKGTADGWVGFAGRKGQNWFKFRLVRVGYLHNPTRAWQDIGGAPSYARAQLTRTTATRVIGPNADSINTGSVARWNRIWTTPSGGQVDVIWRASPDGLKEEIVLNDAGRTWIRNNRPPTTPVAETFFGFVFEVDFSDISTVWRNGSEQSKTGDWSAQDEGVELRDSSARLLAFLPIDDVYLQSDPTVRLRLNRRFYLDVDGKNYLAIGVRCDQLNAMAAGALVFDPTVNEQVAATADDGGEIGTSWGNTAYVGVSSSTTLNSGFRFTTVNVPQGSTIDVATLQVAAYNLTGTITNVHGRLFGDDVDDAAAWGSSSRPSQITQTTALTEWDPTAWVANDWYSIDATAIIAELVARAGWVADNDMRLGLINDGSTNNHFVRIIDYTDSASFAAKLDITYSEAAGGPVIPVFMAQYRQHWN